MIYGLPGLANDERDLNIEINYRKLTIEVYAHVARKLIEHGHVDFLALSQFLKALLSVKYGFSQFLEILAWQKHLTVPT